jgi:peptidoglycan/xylan/chitin deacetylase (PgdA/CDA1 family)
LTRAIERFSSIFGKPSPTHGAAGWQMNEHALVKLDQLGMRYSSDSRARLHDDGRLVEPEIGPYRIALGDRVLQCVQIPTTLPTLDELLGRCIHGVTLGPDTLSKHLLSLTAEPRDHVFTLHAELEGQKLAPIFEQLLIGWQAQGYRFNSMAQYYESLAGASLPIRPLSWGHIPGRSGDVMVA